MRAYNCSPSFQLEAQARRCAESPDSSANWARWLPLQFITLAGFHALNSRFRAGAWFYKAQQMSAYVELQQAEFAAEASGYTATKPPARGRCRLFRCGHQAVIPPELPRLPALSGSTEEQQFEKVALGKVS